MKRWRWINSPLVYAIHDEQLALFGGVGGVLDGNLVESALARPRHMLSLSVNPCDAADIAASYAYGLVRNHPFVDANKRTAWHVARVFLADNGARLGFRTSDAVLAMQAVGDHMMTELEFATWLRRRLN